MFAQVIRGHVTDKAELRRQLDTWHAELAAGADGWLGTTAGVAEDGRGIAIVRFTSAEAARANDERPEQSAWWGDTRACFADEPTFYDSDDVELFLGGGSDDAGFVQVMVGTTTDRTRSAELDKVMTERLAELRPDVIGGLRVWTAPDAFVDVTYFNSEEEARAGEASAMPDDVDGIMSDFEAISGPIEFVDLEDPVLASPA